MNQCILSLYICSINKHLGGVFVMKQKFFDELSQKISETIANSPVKDIEKNIKSMMSSALNKIDLVTREEFEIQQQVLLKTREQLSILEQKISSLEKIYEKDEAEESHID